MVWHPIIIIIIIIDSSSSKGFQFPHLAQLHPCQLKCALARLYDYIPDYIILSSMLMCTHMM